jgi:hypothetical protein
MTPTLCPYAFVAPHFVDSDPPHVITFTAGIGGFNPWIVRSFLGPGVSMIILALRRSM